MTANLEPGTLVRSPIHPEWGIGQVQSNAGGRVTVNFEHVGKLVLSGDAAALECVAPDWL